MKAPPGSFLHLLANDVRINWRSFADMFGGWSIWRRVATVLVMFAALHGIAWGVIVLVEMNPPRLLGPVDIRTVVAGGALLWMISQGLLGASRALHQRGELELLLSSPIAAWKPVAARGLSIAASTFGSLAAFLLPVANVGALRYGPQWLAIYPVSMASAILATAVGFLIAVGLFHAAGPRFARSVAQVTAAVIAGAFVLTMQVLAVLPDGLVLVLKSFALSFEQALPDLGLGVAIGAILDGEPLAVTAYAISSTAAFLLALRLAGPAFVRAAISTAGASIDRSGRTRQHRFAEGPRAVLRRKESRLLARDPNLAAQLGLQIIYTLPLAVILLKVPSNGPPALALVPLVVVLAAQISASLAWLSVSGEEAPELIATAPLKPGRPELAKLTAIAIPLVVILAAPVAAIVMLDARSAIFAVVFGVMAAASTALLNFWHPLPGNRRGMLRRHHQAKIVAIAEHGLALLWACAAVLALMQGWAALVPMALVLILLASFRPRTAPRPRSNPALA